MEMAQDGSLYYVSESGVKYDVNSREDRQKLFASTKNVGAHTGVEWHARKKCMHDLPRFFAKQFGLLPK